MKGLVETTPLYTTRGGVARYVRGLLSGLREIGSDIEWAELGWPVENYEFAQPARAWRTVKREMIWARLTAPRLAKSADVLHHTALPIIPLIAGPRHVVTLHDLALLRYPERFRRWQRTAGLRRLRRVTQADQVIAVSRFTADEAMALLGLPAKRITAIHHGVTLAGQEQVPPDLPSEFFLFVGSLEPGKNLALLKQIWSEAAQSGRALPPLLIVGMRWAGVPGEGPAPAGWQFLGHVDDAVLLALYRRARALLFPSLYEGFGFPVLEGMAAGCPVVCGRVASLPEVATDAAWWADLTPSDFGRAMHEMTTDEAQRDHKIELGRRRAEQFSWSKCATETTAVWREASAR